MIAKCRAQRPSTHTPYSSGRNSKVRQASLCAKCLFYGDVISTFQDVVITNSQKGISLTSKIDFLFESVFYAINFEKAAFDVDKI